MKSDITRSTFNKSKRFSSVQVQQGRITLDADWNEHEEIRKYFERTAIQDTVGLAGTPITPALPTGGFVVTVAGKQVSIGPGHYYVDGILCENDNQVTFANQPFLPLPGDPTTGKALVYLDVYEQFISFWDDKDLSDAALGGRETAGRQRIVWRARTMAVNDPNIKCADAFALVGDSSTGKLASIAKATTTTAVCVPKADASYRRPENQLYRVEVHASGNATAATFKWSRDNGSVVSAASITGSRQVTVAQVGRDQRLSFAAGNYIELIDLPRETRGEAGLLYKVNQVSGNNLQLDPAGPVANVGDFDPATLKARRWESTGAQTITQWKGANTDQPVSSGSPGFGSYVQLEDGVWIRIANGQYAVGDYWLIPARSIIGDVEWPKNGSDPTLLSKFGTTHHYAPLAIVDIDNNAVLRDCRNPYALLKDDIQLFFGGGDGQEAPPISGASSMLTLPEPLTVGVSRGKLPVQNAMVKYTVVAGTGTLTGPNPAPTDAQGMARIQWTLDPTTYFQKVRAVLLDKDGNETHLPIEFSATLRTADKVAYTPPEGCGILSGTTTVKDALDRICDIKSEGGCCVSIGKDGEFPSIEAAVVALQGKTASICLCLDGETYSVGPNTMNMLSGKAGFKTVEISGIRGLTVIEARETLPIQNLTWLSMKDFALRLHGVPVGMTLGSVNRCEFRWIDFSYAPEEITPEAAAVLVQSAGRIQISDCLFFSTTSISNSFGSFLGREARAAIKANDSDGLAKALRASLSANLTNGTAVAEIRGASQSLSFTDPNVEKALKLASSPKFSVAMLNDLSATLLQLSKSKSPFLTSALSHATVREASETGATSAAGFTAVIGAAREVVDPAALVLLNNIIEARITDSQFYNPVILYGPNPPGFGPKPGTTDIPVNGNWQGGGRLWCRGNMFTKIAISATPDGMPSLEEWVKEGNFPQIFTEVKLTDNTFAQSGGLVAGLRVTLTGNTFSFQDLQLPAMWVWGRSASFYGNHGLGRTVIDVSVNGVGAAGTTADNPGLAIT